MLQFNSNGFLVPDSNIISTIEELEREFVLAFNNERRAEIYKRYVVYSNNLKNLLGVNNITQWIDGSFVTMKPNPNDIDLVSFVDGQLLDTLEREVGIFKYPLSLEYFGVDAYIVKTYDRNDRRYALYNGDLHYWMNTFDKAKVSRTGKAFAKGFLEIIY